MHGSGFLKVVLVLMIISLVLDAYVFNGLKTLTARWRSRALRNLVKWGYLFIAVGITVLFEATLRSFATAKGMTPFHEWILSLFLTFLVTKIFFSVVLLLGDIGRFLYGIVRRIVRWQRHNAHTDQRSVRSERHTAHPGATTPYRTEPIPGAAPLPGHLHPGDTPVPPREPLIPGRRRFISEAAVLFAAIPFTSFLYAMLKGKYDFKLHRTTLFFPDLPASFDGFTITQLSDIHSGSFDNTAAVQRGIDLAKAQKSDLFVFTGDLVNNAAWEIEPYIDHFSQLKAPFGQFSILGNHDYGDYIKWGSEAEKAANLDELKEHHKRLGYRLLLDEHIELEKDGRKISLIGVQNWGRGFIEIGDIDKALQGVDKDAFKILLSHDPTHWEEKIRFHPTTIHLTLSGHTHGAQFGVETDKWRWSPVKYRYLDWAGLANEKDRYLYVNRGFGFLAFSGRLGIWPEITVITLKKGNPPAV